MRRHALISGLGYCCLWRSVGLAAPFGTTEFTGAKHLHRQIALHFRQARDARNADRVTNSARVSKRHRNYRRKVKLKYRRRRAQLYGELGPVSDAIGYLLDVSTNNSFSGTWMVTTTWTWATDVGGS